MRNRMLLLGAIAILVAAPALAFHDDGVAHCDGCHTMHNSQGGVEMQNGSAAGLSPGHGYTDLLTYPNATDVCLNCHGRAGGGGYGVWKDDPTVVSDADYYSAGNFVFLTEDNINDGHNGATNPILGEQSGHNLMSGMKSASWDSILTAPPSDGTSPLTNNQLYCSSCHDPHGNASFRLLYQANQTVSVGDQPVTFAATIDAEAISYSAAETNVNHNAYHSGYSEWCSSCHSGFHAGSGNLIHPSGELLSATVIAQYNEYNGTTDCVNNPPSAGDPCGTGVAGTAYLAAVPFEDAATTTTSTAGPAATSQVACVTCHRAHATSAKDAGRWDFTITLLAEDGVESGSWPIPNPYDANQRSLCNKCHAQDEFDHIQ